MSEVSIRAWGQWGTDIPPNTEGCAGVILRVPLLQLQVPAQGSLPHRGF